MDIEVEAGQYMDNHAKDCGVWYEEECTCHFSTLDGFYFEDDEPTHMNRREASSGDN